MKKKVAVYANGWSKGTVLQAIEGMKEYAAKEDFDLFVFVSHASFSEHSGINEGELNIYRLGDIRDFDGVIVFSSMLNSDETVRQLLQKAREYGIPFVSLGLDLEGAHFVGVDNSVGMRQLINHLVEEHGVHRVVYFGGTPDHVDNVERQRITQEVLEEHGLSLDPEDIYYANWEYDGAIRAVKEVLLSPKGRPDAIVCANDVMALAAGSELIRRGVQIPGEIALVGFDGIEDGQYFFPALTSVTQNYAEIGGQACRLIYEDLRGSSQASGHTCRKIKSPTKMVRAESCGCPENPLYKKKRQEFCSHSYTDSLRGDLLDQVEKVLQLHIISPSQDYDSLKRNIRSFYERNHMFEGENFSIVLNPQYYIDVMEQEREQLRDGYDADMEVLVSLEGGKSVESAGVDRHDLVPGYRKREGEQHVYYFLPLHNDRYNYGYAVFQDNPPVFVGRMLYSYLERLQQAFLNLRTNLRLNALNKKLTQLYDKDPMTYLFNRFGYWDKALPLFESCCREHLQMMVMFVDINYMKKINDRYGHIHGDNAIKLVADAIKENVKENWIPVRFGGDEFLIIGPVSGPSEAEQEKQNILNFLEQKNQDGSRPYHISASCGYVLTDPDAELQLQDYIREADAVMYEIKRQVHARDAK